MTETSTLFYTEHGWETSEKLCVIITCIVKSTTSTASTNNQNICTAILWISLFSKYFYSIINLDFLLSLEMQSPSG